MRAERVPGEKRCEENEKKAEAEGRAKSWRVVKGRPGDGLDVEEDGGREQRESSECDRIASRPSPVFLSAGQTYANSNPYKAASRLFLPNFPPHSGRAPCLSGPTLCPKLIPSELQVPLVLPPATCLLSLRCPNTALCTLRRRIEVAL